MQSHTGMVGKRHPGWSSHNPAVHVTFRWSGPVVSSVACLIWTTAAARLCVVLVLMLGMMRTVDTAAAHGGGTLRLSREAAGPYWLSVWTSPDPVQVGELHVTVAVAGRHDDATILGAEILVEISSLDGYNQTLVSQATTRESANKYLYEADVSLPEAGQHLVTITASRAEGRGAAQFEIEVLPYSRMNSVAIPGAGLAVAVVWVLRAWVRKRSKHS